VYLYFPDTITMRTDASFLSISHYKYQISEAHFVSVFRPKSGTKSDGLFGRKLISQWAVKVERGRASETESFWYETGNEICKAFKLIKSYLRNASLGPSIHSYLYFL